MKRKEKTINDANDMILKLRRDEKARWAQRAKVKHIQEGGNNTNNFT
jgi:hypothetical protein